MSIDLHKDFGHDFQPDALLPEGIHGDLSKICKNLDSDQIAKVEAAIKKGEVDPSTYLSYAPTKNTVKSGEYLQSAFLSLRPTVQKEAEQLLKGKSNTNASAEALLFFAEAKTLFAQDQQGKLNAILAANELGVKLSTKQIELLPKYFALRDKFIASKGKDAEIRKAFGDVMKKFPKAFVDKVNKLKGDDAQFGQSIQAITYRSLSDWEMPTEQERVASFVAQQDQKVQEQIGIYFALSKQFGKNQEIKPVLTALLKNMPKDVLMFLKKINGKKDLQEVAEKTLQEEKNLTPQGILAWFRRNKFLKGLLAVVAATVGGNATLGHLAYNADLSQTVSADNAKDLTLGQKVLAGVTKFIGAEKEAAAAETDFQKIPIFQASKNCDAFVARQFLANKTNNQKIWFSSMLIVKADGTTQELTKNSTIKAGESVILKKDVNKIANLKQTSTRKSAKVPEKKIASSSKELTSSMVAEIQAEIVKKEAEKEARLALLQPLPSEKNTDSFSKTWDKKGFGSTVALAEDFANLNLKAEKGAENWLIQMTAEAVYKMKESGDDKLAFEGMLNLTKLFLNGKLGFRASALADTEGDLRGNLTAGAFLPGKAGEVKLTAQALQKEFQDNLPLSGEIKANLMQTSLAAEYIKHFSGIIKALELQGEIHKLEGKTFDKGTQIENTAGKYTESKLEAGFGGYEKMAANLKLVLGKDLSQNRFLEAFKLTFLTGMEKITQEQFLDMLQEVETNPVFGAEAIVQTKLGNFKLNVKNSKSATSGGFSISDPADRIEAFFETIKYENGGGDEQRGGMRVNLPLGGKNNFNLFNPKTWFSKTGKKMFSKETKTSYESPEEVKPAIETRYLELGVRTSERLDKILEVNKGRFDPEVSLDSRNRTLLIDVELDFTEIVDDGGLSGALALENGNARIFLDKISENTKVYRVVLKGADGKFAAVELSIVKGSLIVDRVDVMYGYNTAEEARTGDINQTPTLPELDAPAGWTGDLPTIPDLEEGSTYTINLPQIQDLDGADASAYELYLDGVKVQFNKTLWTYDLPRDLTKGSHTLIFKGQGVDGGEGDNSTPSVLEKKFEVKKKAEVDAPADWTGDLPTIPDLEKGSTYTINLPKLNDPNGVSDDAYKLYLNEVEVPFDKEQWTFDFPTDLQPGEHTLTFKGEGVDGGEGDNSKAPELTVQLKITPTSEEVLDEAASWKGALTDVVLNQGESFLLTLPGLKDNDGVKELKFVIEGQGEFAITDGKVVLPGNLPAGEYTMRLSGEGVDGGEGDNSKVNDLTAKLTIRNSGEEPVDAPAGWERALTNASAQVGKVFQITLPKLIDADGFEYYRFFLNETEYTITNNQVTFPQGLPEGEYTMKLIGQGRDGGEGDNSQVADLTAKLTIVEKIEETVDAPAGWERALTNASAQVGKVFQITLPKLIDADGLEYYRFFLNETEYTITNNQVTFPQGLPEGEYTMKLIGQGRDGGEGDNSQVADLTAKLTVFEQTLNVGDLTFNVNEDLILSGKLTATGPQDLSFQKSSNPAHGTVTIQTNGNFIYTPNPDYFGTDEFNFKVTTKNGKTDEGKVTVTVNSINDNPEAQSGSVSLLAGATVTGQLPLASDKETPAGSLTYHIVTAPQNAQSFSADSQGNFSYTPKVGFTGTDTLTFYVEDANGGNSVEKTFDFVVSSAPDTTPNAFTLIDQAGVGLNTVVTSGAITVGGINAPAVITISGNDGQYSINGGAWTNIAGTLVNGDIVRVRQTASGSYSTAVNTVLTIGGVSDTFTVTTEGAPILPAPLVVASATEDLDAGSDSGISNSDNLTNDTTPTITWGAVANATGYDVSVDGGAWTDIGNVTSLTSGALGDGAHTFAVRGYNADGVRGPDGAAINLTIDTTNPGILDFAGAVPNTKNTVYAGLEMSFTKAIGEVVSLTSSNGGTISNVGINAGNVSFDFETPNMGGTVLTFVVKDEAGNQVTVNKIVTLPNNPVAPLVVASATEDLDAGSDSGISNSDNLTNDTTPTITWGALANAVGYDVSVDGGAWTDIGNVTSLTSGALGDGAHTFAVRGYNADGVRGPDGAAINLTIDTTNPGILDFAGAVPNTKNTVYAGLEMSFTKAIGEVVSLTSSNGGTISNVGINAGNVSFDFETPNMGGTVLTFVVKDEAGNQVTVNKIVTLPNG